MASRFPTSPPRSVALAAMLAAISPAVAFATDLPLPPMVTKAPPLPAIVAPYNWSGLYGGVHLGHLWGRTHVEDNGEIAERNARTDGVVGGVMLGYNWQIQLWSSGSKAISAGRTRMASAPVLPSPILSPRLHLRCLHRRLRFWLCRRRLR